MIANPEPAAQIEVFQMHSCSVQDVDELKHLFKRSNERLNFGNLRADVDVDSDDSKLRQLRRLAVKGECRVVGDAEFAFS